MGRTIKGTNRSEKISLTRTDDLGGGNFVDARGGNDQVANAKEDGNVIKLGSGDDLYVGSGFGNFANERGDRVSGGSGHDQFVFETFKSIYNGDGGNDQFFSAGWQNTINGGAGNDTVSYQFRHEDKTIGDTGVIIDLFEGRVQTGTSRTEFLSSIENAVGSIHADQIGGTNGKNILAGHDDNDEIAGFGGNDTIIGGKGADILAGGDGRSNTANDGADTFVYNSVNDSLISAFDTILDFQTGIDKIDLRGLGGRNTQLSFSDGVEFFSGSRGEVVFSATGGGLFVDMNGDGNADFAIKMDGVDDMSRGDFIL